MRSNNIVCVCDSSSFSSKAHTLEHKTELFTAFGRVLLIYLVILFFCSSISCCMFPLEHLCDDIHNNDKIAEKQSIIPFFSVWCVIIFDSCRSLLDSTCSRAYSKEENEINVFKIVRWERMKMKQRVGKKIMMKKTTAFLWVIFDPFLIHFHFSFVLCCVCCSHGSCSPFIFSSTEITFIRCFWSSNKS